MKRLALATAICLFAAPPAKAQVAVIDAASIAQLAQQIGINTRQLTTLFQQLQQLQMTYNQVVGVYNSLAHLSNINQVAALLNNPLLRNPLPATGVLPGTITGVNASSSLGGAWSGAASTYLGYNTIYLPRTQDFQAQQLQRNANYLSTVQGLAQQNLVALEQRQAALPDIQAQISGARDVQAMAGVQARIAAEQAYVNGQTAQAQNLAVLASAQAAEMRQQEEQRGRWQQDQSKADVCASFGLGGAVCQ